MTSGLRPLSLGFNHPVAPPRNSSDSTYTDVPAGRHSFTPSQHLLRNPSTITPQHQQQPTPRQRNHKQQAPSRARIFFRIVSMLASGITAGLMGDVVLTYYGSKHHTAKGKEVWPVDTWLTPSIVVFVIAAVCCVIEFLWFVGSARQKVRMLEGREWVWGCLLASVVCGCLLLSVAVYGTWARRSGGERETVWWVCEASEKEWEWDLNLAKDGGGKIDLDWVCGELVGGEFTAFVALGAQVGVVATVVLEAVWGVKKGW